MDDRFAPGRIVTRAASRRTLLKRSSQLGAAVAVAGATGGIDAMLAAAKAPALLQDAKPSGKIKLLYQSVAPAEEARFEKFHELYPDIEIEAVAVEGDTWAAFGDNVATRIAGGEKFDVLVIATEGQRVFASRGLLEPIDDLLERDAAEMKDFFDDVHPRLLEFTRTLSSPDGKTYVLPGEFNTMGVWYNKNVFDAAGVAYPDASWT